MASREMNRRHWTLGFQSPIAFEGKAREVSETLSTKAGQVQCDPEKVVKRVALFLS